MARIYRDDVDKFFDYGINIPSRTLYMGSVGSDYDDGELGVDYAMAERMVKGLHLLDTAAPSGDKPISILMNNTGGDEYHGLAIYDAIKTCNNEVNIIVYGHAMSMGSVIFQAADERIMSPNSRMMIHYGTWGVCDHPKIAYNWADEGKRWDKWLVEIYLEKIREKHPKFTKKKVDEMCNFDTFFTPQEAVDIGLADRVLDQ